MNTKATTTTAGKKEWELDYTLKKQPVIAARKKGKAFNELNDARGIALDEHNQLIYIADRGNSRIQVISYDGNFITNFGQGILVNPWGIALVRDYVLVTDTELCGLVQFCEYNLVRTGSRGTGEGELSNPHGLCVDYNGDVYIADSLNNRVCVFSKYSKFLTCFGKNQLKDTKDVKVTPDNVVVLDNSPNCVHFYSRSGHLINSGISNGLHSIVLASRFFCLDESGNILITDIFNHDVRIFSPLGQLIHIIGRIGHRRGEFLRPNGICLSKLGTIFVISRNLNYCIQSF